MPDPLDPEEFVLVDPSDYPIDASAISNEASWGKVGTLRINDSTVSLNASEGPGAGISSWGDSIVTIENGSVITQNRTASDGGGLFTEGGTVTIADSTRRLEEPGRERRRPLQRRARLAVRPPRHVHRSAGSQIIENIAENGGGIYNDGDAQLLVTDTTLSRRTTRRTTARRSRAPGGPSMTLDARRP